MKIKYAFARDGVEAFLDSVLGDTFHAIESGDYVENIRISVGNRELEIPMLAEQYEELHDYLYHAIETEEEF